MGGPFWPRFFYHPHESNNKAAGRRMNQEGGRRGRSRHPRGGTQAPNLASDTVANKTATKAIWSGRARRQ